MSKVKKTVKKIAVACLAMAVFVSVSACAKEKEFDAAGYVKNSLDAVYHQDYKAYAEDLGVSEDDAKADLEKNFQEVINQELVDFEGITEEGISRYSEAMRNVNKLAKYEVLEAKKTEDGSYVVKVSVEPTNIFQTLEKSSEEVSTEKIEQGLDPTSPEVFSSVLAESVQRSIEKNSYGETVTVEVTVTKDESGAYGLEQSEMDKIGSAIFPE